MSSPVEAPSPPRLSIVVAAWTGGEALQRCVRSLQDQLRPGDDIIVASNFAWSHSNAPYSAGARIIDLPLDPGTTVPELRAAGLAAASGSIVAFTEDHCVVTPGWREALLRGYETGAEGVGGPVGLAPGGRPLDWAVYFYDYARFAPPMRSGLVRSLSGANMSFARSFLETSRELLRHEVLESILEREFLRRGRSMYLEAEAIVVHGARQAVARSVVLAFALARGYAAGRVENAPRMRRLGFASATPLLPLVLAARILAAMAPRGKLGRLALATPWLALLLGSWSAGECAGYLAGAGNSRRLWR